VAVLHSRDGRRASRPTPVAAVLALVALLVSALLAGCSAGGDGSSEGGTTDPSLGAAGTFTNPVYDADFPDPQVIKVGATYWAYGTNGALGNLPTLRSDDLVEWEEVGDGMPQLAPWVQPGKTWAPEVMSLAPNRYLLYYTAAGARQGRQCIGRAVATTPEGPFTDTTTAPLVCQTAEGGSIDASPFRAADGSLYLLWKNDGNCCGLDTWLYVQRMSPDGLRLVGERRRLLQQDAPWEGSLVEAPFLWEHDGRFFLFYSANAYDQDAYAVGYATCGGPMGPCRKAPDNPVLSSEGEAAGPGHCSLVEVDGRTWMLYHAWPADSVGDPIPGRTLWLDEVVWTDGVPKVEGPSDDPQEAP